MNDENNKVSGMTLTDDQIDIIGSATEGLTDEHGFWVTPCTSSMRKFARAIIAAQRASFAAKAAAPCGWVQFKDGVQTQNFARDEQELAIVKSVSLAMSKGATITYMPVYPAPAADVRKAAPDADELKKLREWLQQYLRSMEDVRKAALEDMQASRGRPPHEIFLKAMGITWEELDYDGDAWAAFVAGYDAGADLIAPSAEPEKAKCNHPEWMQDKSGPHDDDVQRCSACGAIRSLNNKET